MYENASKFSFTATILGGREREGASERGRESGREGGRALSARDAGLEGGAVAIGAAGGRGDGGEEEEFISIGEEKGGRGGDAQRSR